MATTRKISSLESPKSSKTSPLKVVSPILKKYSTQRHPKLRSNLKFTRSKLSKILGSETESKILLQKGSSKGGNLSQEDNTKISEKSDVGNVKPDPSTVKAKVSSPSSSKTKSKSLTNSGKKKQKPTKSFEATLAFFDPVNTADEVEKLELNYAINYFKKVRERLIKTENQQYRDFLTIFSTFEYSGASVAELYSKLSCVLTNHQDLLEEFTPFLSPGQSLDCGVFMNKVENKKMLDFITGVDYFFAKSPQHIKKIHSVLETLGELSSTTIDDVNNLMLPLLKGNQVLMDYFTRLLPDSTPSDVILTDFEELKHSQLNNEEDVEVIELDDVEDKYGGENCPCKCHESDDDKYQMREQHCLPCRTKYVNGKIFVQVEKHLRPAKILFDTHDMTYHKKRLGPCTDSKNDYKESSPVKTNITCSSDDFKSDEEDGSKLKGSKSLKKSPKRKEKCSKKLFSSEEPQVIQVDFENILEISFKDEKMEVVKNPPSLKSVKDEYSVTTDEDTQLDSFDIVNQLVSVLPSADKMEKVRESQSLPIIEDSTDKLTKSPPVISIPSSSLLPDATKPILSLLSEIE